MPIYSCLKYSDPKRIKEGLRGSMGGFGAGIMLGCRDT